MQASGCKFDECRTMRCADESNECASPMLCQDGCCVPGSGAPLVDAGDNQTVQARSTVRLVGMVTDSDDPVEDLNLVWRQLSGDVTVQLTNANTSEANFDAPDVEQNVTLTFDLRATDPRGQFASDITEVTVEPSPEDSRACHYDMGTYDSDCVFGP